MASPPSEAAGRGAPVISTSVKVLVAGGPGSGKTTFVRAISEISPLCTEERRSGIDAGAGDLREVTDEHFTTVAMDFGRITLGRAELMLFGTPGQERFRFMWNDLKAGAKCAVVLVDVRRLEHSFAPVAYFEQQDMPFIVAANAFDGHQPFTPLQLADALHIDPAATPVLTVDARDAADVHRVLVTLMDCLTDRTGAT